MFCCCNEQIDFSGSVGRGSKHLRNIPRTRVFSFALLGKLLGPLDGILIAALLLTAAVVAFISLREHA